MKEPSFGALLSQFLQTAKLSHEELYGFIAKRREASTSSVKERIRIARNRGDHAHEFPFIAEITWFLESRAEPQLANRLRHIVAHQRTDLGVSDSMYRPNAGELSKLSWLRFPISTRIDPNLIKRWHFALLDGDYSLYRSSLITFNSLSHSFTHAPFRKSIALHLAQSAITHGDYVDAYVICRRYELAWIDAVIRYRKHDRSVVDPNTAHEVFNYLKCLQFKATATSHLFFDSPSEFSSSYFEMAARAIRISRRRQLITKSMARSLQLQIRVRYGRALSRSLIGACHEGIESDSGYVELWKELKDLSKRLSEGRDPDLDYFTAWDTIARLSALLLGRESINVHERELAASDLDYEQQTVEDLHGSATRHAKEALVYSEELEGGYREGKPSRIKAYRAHVTELISITALLRIGEIDKDFAIMNLQRKLDQLALSVGPQRLRHSKYMLFSLEQMIEHVLDDPQATDRKGSLHPQLSSDARKRLMAAIEKQASEVQELYFMVDPDSDIQKLTILEANRLNNGSLVENDMRPDTLESLY